MGAEFVSRYVWRGSELDGNPHIQPFGSIEINPNEQSYVNFGVYGSYGFSGGYSENDFILECGYETNYGGLVAKVADYYFPHLNIPFSNFTDDTLNAHTVEASLAYNGPVSFPFKFLVSQNVHGYDKGSKSFYMEAGLYTTINNIDIDIFIGAAQGISWWHSVNTDKLEIVNTGVNLRKTIKVTEDLSLPAGVSFVYNPHIKNSFLIFSISI